MSLIAKLMSAVLSARRERGEDVLAFWLSEADFATWQDVQATLERHDPLHALRDEFGFFFDRPVHASGAPGRSMVMYQMPSGQVSVETLMEPIAWTS